MDDRSLLKVVMEVIGRERCLDDAALVPFQGACLVATTDMLHETTDFPAAMSDWQRGWMSIAVTLSDIAAMGAEPLFLLIAAGLDEGSRLEEILKGAKACADEYGGEIVGGDIDYHQELTIVTSGVGVAGLGEVIRRGGSRPGDALCITGIPGRAQAALEGFHEHEQALFLPRPRVHEGRILAKSRIATGMMDTSDGLSLSLYDMLEANTCGYAVESEKIPLPSGVPQKKALEFALYGGGDYELLFSCPFNLIPVPGVSCTVIGHVIGEHQVLLDGKQMPKRGYQHRWAND
jgi:thiamine-monophosphate kinase